MLVSDFTSLINAVAALVYAFSKLVRSVRRPP